MATNQRAHRRVDPADEWITSLARPAAGDRPGSPALGIDLTVAAITDAADD